MPAPQTRRGFIERHAPAWAARAAERRRSGTAPDLVVADILDRIVAGMRAELAALPPDPAPIATADAITWSSPIFRSTGRFDPFAGTKRERMLASADVCDRIGAPDAARAYRALADLDAPEILHGCDGGVSGPPKRRPRTGSWSGPAIAPPEPAPFVAGPQLGFAL